MPDLPAKPLLDSLFLAKLEQLELVSRKIFLGVMKGERRSKRKGQSVEFADYRNYTKGDDLRFLDWNIYGRLDRLFIRLFMEEEDLHFYLLIDNSLSMDFGTPTKLRYGKQIAAALAFIGLVNMDRVVIEAFNDRITQSHAGRTRSGRKSSVRGMLDFLHKLEPAGPSNLRESLRSFSIKSSGKGVVVLLTDLMDKGGYEEALRYLVARQFDIYVIQILSQEETDPEILGDLKLIDVEDADEAEVTRYRAPLIEPLQEEPRRVSVGGAGVLQPPRHHLFVHQQPGPLRPPGADLFAAARVGKAAHALDTPVFTMKPLISSRSCAVANVWFPMAMIGLFRRAAAALAGACATVIAVASGMRMPAGSTAWLEQTTWQNQLLSACARPAARAHSDLARSCRCSS